MDDRRLHDAEGQAMVLATISHEAHTSEAQDHQRPRRGLRHGCYRLVGCYGLKADIKSVPIFVLRIGSR